MGFNFGDKLLYNSPVKNGLQTECIFIRDDNGKAVVMFPSAEWAARVNYKYLSRKSFTKLPYNFNPFYNSHFLISDENNKTPRRYLVELDCGELLQIQAEIDYIIDKLFR